MPLAFAKPTSPLFMSPIAGQLQQGDEYCRHDADASMIIQELSIIIVTIYR